MGLVVTLSVVLVTVVSNRKQVLVGAALVRLVVTSPQLVVLGVEGEFATLDDLGKKKSEEGRCRGINRIKV